VISRRAFVASLSIATVLTPSEGEAQQAGKIPVIGVLTSNPGVQISAFIEALRELSYEDGRNVRLAIRSAGTEIGRLPGFPASRRRGGKRP
jgi:hypothetical protein